MNCKPGDLAIVVSTLGYPRLDRCRGMIVKVTAVYEVRHPFGAMWAVEDHPLIEHVADACLRPIRDPGDDAQDESFRWAPAPEKVYA